MSNFFQRFFSPINNCDLFSKLNLGVLTSDSGVSSNTHLSWHCLQFIYDVSTYLHLNLIHHTNLYHMPTLKQCYSQIICNITAFLICCFFLNFQISCWKPQDKTQSQADTPLEMSQVGVPQGAGWTAGGRWAPGTAHICVGWMGFWEKSVRPFSCPPVWDSRRGQQSPSHMVFSKKRSFHCACQALASD